MKVILKCGEYAKNKKAEVWFMKNIFPILDFGIAFEYSSALIEIFEKGEDESNRKCYVDPTVEVIVELTEKARNMAMDPEVSEDELKKHTGQFHDEAMAIRFLQAAKLDFSIEYYSCRYKPLCIASS